jgi:hypothetical protein
MVVSDKERIGKDTQEDLSPKWGILAVSYCSFKGKVRGYKYVLRHLECEEHPVV